MAAVLTSAGCSTEPGERLAPAVIVSLPADPAAALAQAATQLGAESARFTLRFGKGVDGTFGIEISGVADPATGDWEMTGKEYELRRIGDEVYVKLTAEPRLSFLPGAYTKEIGHWIHKRLPYGDGTTIVFSDDFPWSTARRAGGMTDPARTGGRVFQGRIKGAGDADGFCLAELDGTGRFVRVEVGLAVTDPVITVDYSDFGLPVRIEAPPADQTVEEEDAGPLSWIELGEIF